MGVFAFRELRHSPVANVGAGGSSRVSLGLGRGAGGALVASLESLDSCSGSCPIPEIDSLAEGAKDIGCGVDSGRNPST